MDSSNILCVYNGMWQGIRFKKGNLSHLYQTNPTHRPSERQAAANAVSTTTDLKPDHRIREILKQLSVNEVNKIVLPFVVSKYSTRQFVNSKCSMKRSTKVMLYNDGRN